jgi:hypothetical protein
LRQLLVVFGREDDQLIIGLAVGKDAPTVALNGRCGCAEVLLERLETAEVLVNLCGQCAGRFAAAAVARRGHVRPENAVEEMAGAVKGRLAFPMLDEAEITGGARLSQLRFCGIQPIHVRQMVLVMVQPHGLLVNVRLQRVIVIREGREFVRHGDLLA